MEDYVFEFVNVEEALKLLGGYEQIYKKLVIAFLENQKDSVELILLNLETDLKEARRLVHSVKGIAMNLGAKQLYEISTQLELSILNNATNQIQDDFLVFSTIFNKTYDELAMIK